MPSKIFVNLPVKNLSATKEFFGALGYSFNPQFSDEKAVCMVISEDIYAMLLVEEYFGTFTAKKIADAKQTTEVLIALSHDSKEAVLEIAAKAVKAGGRVVKESDLGFMFQRSVEDLDGHIWEHFWMDPAAIQQQS